jgi:hypothetical protein
MSGLLNDLVAEDRRKLTMCRLVSKHIYPYHPSIKSWRDQPLTNKQQQQQTNENTLR